MSIVKWFKNLFAKEESNTIDIPEGVDVEQWCQEQVMAKCLETGSACYGSWENGKFTVKVCDE